jgi:transposase
MYQIFAVLLDLIYKITPVEIVSKRQVIDIPVIKLEYIEHQVFKKQCSWGQSSCASFPENVNASISYGANEESLVG